MKSIDIKSFEIHAGWMTLLCLMGAATGSYLLYEDLNLTDTGVRGQPLASLTRREAKVWRKQAASFAWQSINENDDIYKKESIQTGPSSAAVIRLKDGSVLELRENSLVVIDDAKNLSLDFLKGSVKGSVLVHKATGEDQQISVGSDGKAEVKEFKVRLSLPAPLAEFFAEERGSFPVPFAWEIKGEAASPSLQISKDKAFRAHRTETIPLPDGVHEMKKPLSPGLYFWRITGDNGTQSQTAQFRITAASPLVPVWPNPKNAIRSYGNTLSQQFQWALPRNHGDDIATQRHEIEISSDAAFSSVLAHQDIAALSTSAVVANLPPGRLFWRLRSHYGDLKVTSRVENFLIERMDKVAIDLISPADGEALRLQPQFRFSWQCDVPALQYSWELQTASGTRVAFSSGLNNSALAKDLTAGSYRWRVSAQMKDNPLGATDWRSFSVISNELLALEAPAKDQRFQFWEKPDDFSFQWKKDPLTATGDYLYLLEIAKDPAFRTPLVSRSTKDTEIPHTVLTEALGNVFPISQKYFWRVRVVDEKGQMLKTSEPMSFAFGLFPLLNAPEVSPAANKTVFNLRDDPEPPLLSWIPMDEAKSYEVTILKQGSKPIKKVLTETTLKIGNLPEGKYQWSIRAFDRLKRPGETSPLRDFSVTFGKPLAAPKILTREVQ